MTYMERQGDLFGAPVSASEIISPNKIHDWCKNQDGGLRCFRQKSMFDFDALDDAFLGNIKPTDIDGFVQVKHNFLVLEFKSAMREGMDAQKQSLYTLAHTINSGNNGTAVVCTVAVNYEKREVKSFRLGYGFEGAGVTPHYQFENKNYPKETPWFESNLEHLKLWIKNWCYKADPDRAIREYGVRPEKVKLNPIHGN